MYTPHNNPNRPPNIGIGITFEGDGIDPKSWTWKIHVHANGQGTTIYSKARGWQPLLQNGQKSHSFNGDNENLSTLKSVKIKMEKVDGIDIMTTQGNYTNNNTYDEKSTGLEPSGVKSTKPTDVKSTGLEQPTGLEPTGVESSSAQQSVQDMMAKKTQSTFTWRFILWRALFVQNRAAHIQLAESPENTAGAICIVLAMDVIVDLLLPEATKDSLEAILLPPEKDIF